MSWSKVLVKVSGWVPIFIVWLLFAWASYTYIVEICIYMVSNVVERSIYLVIFIFFLFMSIWSYLKVTFTETAKVPYQFYLTNIETHILLEDKSEKNEILEAKALKLRVQGRTMTGGIRFCEICKCVKPDRAHHCSTCRRCILKMDHHCPWINNCVCYNNYKYFFLFLFYASLLCIFILISSTQYFIKFWQSKFTVGGYGKFNIVFLFFLALVFSFSLLSLLMYHAYLCKINRTTLGVLLYTNSSKAKRDLSLPDLDISAIKDTSLPFDSSSFSITSSSTKSASVMISHLNVVLFFIFSVGLAATITPLMCFHLRIASVNLTTLESMRAPIFRSGPDKNAYNKGAAKNLVEVFGSSLFLAFLPVSTEIGDGITFIPRISPVPSGYRSLESTNESNNQRQITSSAAMTPHILTEVVAVQPQIEE